MEHLDDSAEAYAAVTSGAEGLCGEKEEQRPDVFAAACDEVFGDVGDDGYVGGGLTGELLLDGSATRVELRWSLFRG